VLLGFVNRRFKKEAEHKKPKKLTRGSEVIFIKESNRQSLYPKGLCLFTTIVKD
jgi:hypothetical protein